MCVAENGWAGTPMPDGHCPAEGDHPMTPEQIRDFALTLYTVIVESDAVAELTVWQRCLQTCRVWGLEPPVAALISEALTSYLSGGTRQAFPLVTDLDKAQAVLQHTMGGALDVGPRASARSTRVAPYAIAAMVEWVLHAEETVR
jgi:hypothetical protein